MLEIPQKLPLIFTFNIQQKLLFISVYVEVFENYSKHIQNTVKVERVILLNTPFYTANCANIQFETFNEKELSRLCYAHK